MHTYTQARTTVGLTLFGSKVDYVVPGGPAHLSQLLEKNDEIIAVDGMYLSCMHETCVCVCVYIYIYIYILYEMCVCVCEYM